MYFHGTRPSEWYSQEGPHQRGHDPSSSSSSGVGRQPPRKMINLEHLTEEERKIIMDVLQRDEQLRQSEQERVKKLKTELHDLRRKSAVKVDETSGGADSSKKVCARCREPLGTIFNSGEVCPRCQHKVCSNCKVVLPSSKKWLCTICNKQLQIRLESGDAFGPIKEGQAPVYGSDLVKMSLAKTKPELEHKVLINGSPQSPADSGFHGRGANVSSVGESTMYEDDYPSDISNEQSIGPSVSEHGSIAHRGPGPATNNDEGTIVRNDMDRGHYDAADITVERVSSRNGSPAAGQRGNAADAIQYEKSSSRRHHGHVTSEGSEDERSYRSNGSGGRHPAIPTIAIQDAGDSSFSESEYYYSGSERLHRQALEANLYRDSNATDHTDGAVPTSNATKGNKDDSKVTPNGRAGRAQKKDKPGTVPALQIDPPSDKPTTPASPFVEVHVDIEREPTFKPELSKVDDRLPSLPQDDESIGKADSLPRFASRSSASSVSSPVERRLSKKNMQFKGSTSSLTSLYSTGEEFYGKYPITGDVSFGLGYNFKTNVFEIKIGGCRDLVPIEAKKNKSDPYIKTYLLPDKSKNSKRKTKTKKGTINPNYSENLKYPIPQSELETRTLSVAVWHYDRFGHNMFLGEVLVPLDGVDLTSYPVKWHQLKTRVPPTETKPISYKGDIVLALMFETLVDENKNGTNGSTKTASRRKKKGLSDKQIGGTLKVHIKEAKNLTPPRVGAAVNPYVKVYLEPDRSKTGKKKTATMRNTINPSYEQSLEYPNMTEDILKERALEVGIWDSEVGSSSLLGGVRLGPGTGKSYGRGVDWQDSTGIEIQLWEEMLRNHNQWVEASLTLRASFDKKT